MVKLIHLAFAAVIAIVMTPRFSYASNVNMPYGVSPISHDIYNLHMLAFIICCFIGLIVFALIGYCLFHFRKSKGAVSADIHENHLLEFFWTLIPFLILIGLAIPATLLLGRIHNTDSSALTIKVTGYQWRWEYEYLNSDIRFFSYMSTPLNQIYSNAAKNKWFLLEVDNPMIVPVNTKVKLLITSDDVIHSWWVPELGVKQDAIPGFVNENWIYATEVGEYRGQCGELCGVNHGFMPIVVKVVTAEDYAKWVADKKAALITSQKVPPPSNVSAVDMLTLGKTAYERNCAMCHQNDGKGLSYSFPALQASRVVTAPLDETILYIMRGVPGTSMQAFGNILDDTTFAEVVTYIRQAWGNDVIVKQQNYALTATPSDIKRVRSQFAAQLGV